MNIKAGDYVILLEKYNDLEKDDITLFQGIDPTHPYSETELGYNIANIGTKKTYKIFMRRLRKEPATIPEIVKAKLLGKFR